MDSDGEEQEIIYKSAVFMIKKVENLHTDTKHHGEYSYLSNRGRCIAKACCYLYEIISGDINYLRDKEF